MKRFSLIIAVLAVAGSILLAGCAPSVTVRHPLAPARMKATDVPKLARIVAVMTPDERSAELASATAGGAALGQILSALTAGEDQGEAELPVSPSRTHEALGLAAYKLESPYSHVIAHMAKGPSTDAFLSIIAPSAVLWLEPSVVKASRQEGVIEHKDPKTGQVTKTTVFAHTANWTVRWRLVSWPDGADMASGSEGWQSTERLDQPVDLAEWMPDQAGPLAGWADSVRAQILPRIAYRYRRIWKEKHVKADSTGGYAAWNAGVTAEQQGHWEEAKAKYRTALASTKKAGDRIKLNSYLGQLEWISESRAAGSSGDEGWFSEPIAVAPFANDTNNVGAPDMVRAMVQDELVLRGYAPIPLAEADRRFRSAGISQGEHLKAISPAKVAAATGVKRILVGKVDEFKIINVGVYYRRQARVTLSMRDEQGRTVWQAPGVSVRQTLAKPRDAGKMLLAGLIGATLEKLTKTYLKEDVGYAMQESLPYLPARDKQQPQARQQQRRPATVQRRPAPATAQSAPAPAPPAQPPAPVSQPASVPGAPKPVPSANQPAGVPPVVKPVPPAATPPVTAQPVPAPQPVPPPATTPPVVPSPAPTAPPSQPVQPAQVPVSPKTETLANQNSPVTQPAPAPAVQPAVVPVSSKTETLANQNSPSAPEPEKPGKAVGHADEKTTVPPGQEKKDEELKPGKAVGHADEKTATPPGQEKKDEGLKPGKAAGHADEKTATPPGQEKKDEELKPGKATGHEDEKPSKLDKDEKAAAKEDKAEKQEEKKAKDNAPEKPATPVAPKTEPSANQNSPAEKSPVPETKTVPGSPPAEKKPADAVKDEKTNGKKEKADADKTEKVGKADKGKDKDDTEVKDDSPDKTETKEAPGKKSK
jgi:hypothetical protein